MKNIQQVIIPRDTKLYQSFQQMATHQRIILFAGLPGVGKSLLLQQLSLMAHQVGRVVHLLQWDVTRAAFETDDILARYPEVEGVTHVAIRKAVGLWAREAIRQWRTQYPEPENILIGEAPLIGNRLIELGQVRPDAAEPLLRHSDTLFVIPVPSKNVRQVIEAARERSIVHPQHEREAADAAPSVLRALWHELYELAQHLGLVDQATIDQIPYDPHLYKQVYQHLLQHRRTRILSIDRALSPHGSAYELNIVASELAASPETVQRIMAQVERAYTPAQLAAEVERWFVMN